MTDSLPARIVHHWARDPSRPQLRDTDGSWISAGELESRSRKVAHALLARGFEPGARVLLSAPSSAGLVVALLGALRAGVTVVPLNTAYTEHELGRIAAVARPVAVLAPDELERWPAPAAGEIDRARSEDVALLMFTSGTTGEPKGVPLTHGNLLAGVGALERAWRWSAEDRLLLTLPLFHVHGLGAGLLGSLCAGAAIELRPGFYAADVAQRAASGTTLFFGVPAMYERLVRAGCAAALAPLRLLVSGSAPLSTALARKVARETGQVPLERYGMTETMMLTSNPLEGPRKPGTVGVPLPGVELRLAADGEVQVRGPSVISGYWGQSNGESFTADGWFATGDLGEFDGDGYLRLVGRSKELIITGGYNVHPREVEEVLALHPAVAEVAVVGRPSERWGEEVTAVVVAAGKLDEAELLALARERLAPYKVPKRVERADSLPRNALGKLVRGRL